MGWSESPDFFCAATETAKDIAESYNKSETSMSPHPDEHTVLDINWDSLPKPK